MKWTRRRLLMVGGAVAGLSAAGMGQARSAAREHGKRDDAGSVSKRIALHNLHTDERLDLEFFRDGYLPESMAAIEVLLRDFRNGERHPIDPHLMDILHEASRGLGVEPVFHVISGYRSPRTNALLHERSAGVAVRSLHLEGRAIDVRLVGVDCADLAGHALGMARGGVGYYRRSDFVHLDTGAFRTWKG